MEPRTWRRANRRAGLGVVALVLLLVASMLVPVGAASSARGSPGAASSSPAGTLTGSIAPPASGSVSLSVVTFARDNVTNGTTTLSVANGGSFGSGTTISLCLSASEIFNSGTAAAFGSYTLPAGTTTLTAAPLPFGIAGATGTNFPSTSPFAGYVALTDSAGGCGGAGASYTAAVPVSIPVSGAPLFQLLPATQAAGASAPVEAGGWDAGATVLVSLATGSSSAFPVTYTTDASGTLAATAVLTVPADLAAGSYALIAQETAAPAPGARTGISVDTTVTVGPSVSVAPLSTRGDGGAELTVNGFGFPAGATIGTNTITLSTETIPGYTAGQTTGTTHAAVSAALNGQFTVTVSLNGSIDGGGGGPGDVHVTYQSGASGRILFTQAAAFFVSNPNPSDLRIVFSPTYGIAGTPFAAEVWNFPASTSVSVQVGSAIVGTITTDGIGFAALPGSALVPALVAGTYLVEAEADGMSAEGPSPSTFVISAGFQAIDPAGVPLEGEYVPSQANLTIEAYGLATGVPYTALDYQVDCRWAIIGCATNVTSANGGALLLSISVGTLVELNCEFGPCYGVLPAANGTVVFTYSAQFFYSTNGTGPSSGITFGPATGEGIDYGTGTAPINAAGYDGYNYSAVDDLFQGLGVYLKSAEVLGGILYVNETDLIPAAATEFYPGIRNVYSFYWNSTELANATGVTDFTSFGGALGFAYTDLELLLPTNLGSGAQTIALVYAGTSASAAIDSQSVVGSLPGSSLASGGVHFVPGNIPGLGDPLGFQAYDLQPGSYAYVSSSTAFGVVNVTAKDCAYTFNNANGEQTYSTHLIVPTSGAVGADIGECSMGQSASLEPAGMYSVSITVQNPTSGAKYTVSTPFTITPSAYVNTTSGSPAHDYSPICPQEYPIDGFCAAYPGARAYVTTNGLSASASYDVYVGPTMVGTYSADRWGGSGWIDANWTFEVPSIAPGYYTVSVVPAGEPLTSALAESPLLVLGSEYAAVFTQGTLPSGTSWSVTLNGVTESSTGTTIAYTEPNGTFDFSVGAVPGYSAAPSSGSIRVEGAAVSTPVTFSAAGPPLNYLLQFTETGLPPGSSWSVSVNGIEEFSTTPTISYSEPNGTYGYTIGTVAGYTAAPSSGSVMIAGGGAAVPVVFTSSSPQRYYAVQFSESNLPSGTLWSVTFNGTTNSSTTSTIGFEVANGSYSFRVGVVPGYVALPASGLENVSGSSIGVDVSFSKEAPSAYTVTFTESGMPVSAGGGVAFDGASSVPFGPGGTVSFSDLANGTYSYTITAGAGYELLSSTPASPITVDGADAAVSVEFEAAFYSVTFTESGMPPSAGGGVAFAGGASVPFNASGAVSFTDRTNGSYLYTISAGAGYDLLSATPSSPIVVSGSDVVVAVVFEAAFYSVTFTESGMPPAAGGGVALDGGSLVPFNASGAVSFTDLTNGSYPYVVTAGAGYDLLSATPSSPVQVAGGDAAVAALFEAAFYSVSFAESGMPLGAGGGVAFNGAPSVPFASSAELSFGDLANGSYPYTITVPAGYVLVSATPGSPIAIDGADAEVAVTFAATYTVTFVESGLPSGTDWMVTFAGAEESATAPASVAVSGVENGTYLFSIGAIAGYTAAPASGSIEVNGSAVNETIEFTAFTPGAYPVTFIETGLPAGTSWSVTLGTTTRTSSTSSISFSLPNGSYEFDVAPAGPWYAFTGGNGTLTVQGAGETLAVTFSYTTVVTFRQTGIPNGTMWTVEATRTSASPLAAAAGGAGGSWFANSTGRTAELPLMNGTYTYRVSASGYSSSTGPLTVNGQAVTVPVTFSANSSAAGVAGWLYALLGIGIAVVVIAIAIALLWMRRRRAPPSSPAADRVAPRSGS